MAERTPVESRPVAGALDAARSAALSPLCIVLLTACCFGVRLLRTHAEIGPHYAFVGANLVLAWIPLLLAYCLSWSARSKLTWFALPPVAVLWILFLPNAPYLVTDLVHLQDGVNAVNVVLLSLLALIGILIGVKSVQLVQGAVERLFGPVAGWRAVQAVAVLTAVGVYVGRVLRWNSWTIFHHPEVLVHAVLRSPSEPGRLGMALFATVIFAIGFLVVYRVLAGPRIVQLARPVSNGTTR
jgi:uncharacterized membrane protein